MGKWAPANKRLHLTSAAWHDGAALAGEAQRSTNPRRATEPLLRTSRARNATREDQRLTRRVLRPHATAARHGNSRRRVPEVASGLGSEVGSGGVSRESVVSASSAGPAVEQPGEADGARQDGAPQLTWTLGRRWRHGKGTRGTDQAPLRHNRRG